MQRQCGHLARVHSARLVQNSFQNNELQERLPAARDRLILASDKIRLNQSCIQKSQL